MAGKIIADTLEHSTAGSLSTEYVVNGSAKVWCNNDQNSTHDIADSFNIASVTDAGTGRSDYAYSNAMSSSAHAPQSSGYDSVGFFAHALYNVATTGHTVGVNGVDLEGVYTTTHGDLA
jgi:hypothetical protein